MADHERDIGFHRDLVEGKGIARQFDRNDLVTVGSGCFDGRDAGVELGPGEVPSGAERRLVDLVVVGSSRAAEVEMVDSFGRRGAHDRSDVERVADTIEHERESAVGASAPFSVEPLHARAVELCHVFSLAPT